jgi:hypothetical protein
MTFSAFLEEVKKLKLDEQRAQTAEYLEAVIARDALGPLVELLTSRFGPPLKPEGCLPSGDANRRAKMYGGIRKNQTMYFRQDGDFCECVFLWPWEGGARVTVKIIQVRNEPDPKSGWKDLWARFFSKKS